MVQDTKSIPKWILIISAFFFLLALVVTSTLLFSPQSALKTVDLNAKGFDYLVYMWAARQFSIGFIFGFATFKKSAPMLTLSYIFFLVMNICDVFIGISQRDYSLIGGAFFMCMIASSMIYFINKNTKHNDNR
jgi:Ca2+/Na+ antiporter